MFSTALLGWFGAALSMSLPWPQVYRSCIQGRTGGLSATACWLGLAMPVGWITYGLLSGETVQVVTNTVNGAAGLGVLAVVLWRRDDLRTGRKLLVTASGAAGVLAAVVVSVAVAALTDATGAHVAAVLGLILAGTSFVSAIPQPLSLLRDRTQDLSGLSPLRWRLAAGACASWMTYGLTTGQTAVWLSAVVGLTSALIVCSILFLAGRTAPAAAPVAEAVPVARGVAAVARPARGTARVVRPAAVPARVAASAVSAAAVTASAATAVSVATAVSAAVTVSAGVTATLVRPGPARVVRAAAAVTRSARPVSGPRVAPVRVPRPARPAAARPVRGIARVATA
ncbi:SemiSWEET transporter [Couchioplanes caeruleus]|uniref:SemiSWEET transporter n=1 Tax=Couchioplanes caeruleus TaxID=56438 RepID=UPI0023DF74F1|nr:SemiSWEET transporter [Couchioplanes caeruleus]